MKIDSPLLSDTTDVIALSALLREVIAEERERPPRPARGDVPLEARPDEGRARRLPQPQGYPTATLHPVAGSQLNARRLESVATTDREAVA